MSASLTDLLERTRNHPLLTAREEVELSRRIAAGRRALAELDDRPGDPELQAIVADGEAAKQRFLMANLRLVVSIARRIPPPSGMDMDDLVQEGILGLEHAVDKYDGDRGYKFSTYATWWIRQAIGRAIDAGGPLIRIPTHRSSDLRARLRAADGDPTQLDPERARLYWLSHTSSLDQPVSGNPDADDLGSFLAGTEVEPGERVVGDDEARRVRLAVDLLAPRAQEAVIRRFGLDGEDPETYVQIGARLGISPEAARRLVERSMERLRTTLERGERRNDPVVAA